MRVKNFTPGSHAIVALSQLNGFPKFQRDHVTDDHFVAGFVLGPLEGIVRILAGRFGRGLRSVEYVRLQKINVNTTGSGEESAPEFWRRSSG